MLVLAPKQEHRGDTLLGSAQFMDILKSMKEENCCDYLHNAVVKTSKDAGGQIM
jgi:hypothetical protein